MFNVNVKLSTVKDVQEFVKICTRFDLVDIDIISGRYIIDAKSIMGIFSLDLSKPLKLNIHMDKDDAAELLEALQHFIVE